MSELLLVSTELREPYEPRACKIVKRLASATRSDLALVTIKPPLPKRTYDTEEDIDQLILASRFEGKRCFQIGIDQCLCIFVDRKSPSTEVPTRSLTNNYRS
jgi:hypothetical protein